MLTSKIFCGILFPMSTLNDHQETKILTQVKKVDAQHPDMTIIREAAAECKQNLYFPQIGFFLFPCPLSCAILYTYVFK